ncbi:MAG: glutamate synthase-related protein [Acidimicrobiia bacterium]
MRANTSGGSVDNGRTAARRRAEIDSCGIGFVADAQGRTSRSIVEAALTGLANVRHRGAIAADGVSGDGAGILTTIPGEFFARIAHDELGGSVAAADVGVVTAFLDRHKDSARSGALQAVAAACAAEGIKLVGFRTVPVDDAQIGRQAKAELPAIVQAVLQRPDGVDDAEAERRAYRARRRAEAQCAEERVRNYFASWSFRTVTYKALVTSDRLAAFYPDLSADDFVAPLAVFHSRFSTNTSPAWERAQPFRMICHNGEINTIAGNHHRMLARGRLGTEEIGLGEEEIFRPVLDVDDSDSGKVDAAVELLARGGRDPRHVLAMLAPQAWEGQRDLPPDVRDFFRYHACLSEPWDGPAALIYTDGRLVGASLDRNGLRPMRYHVCEDGLVVCASEVGAVPTEGHGAVARGRLGPGQAICVDPDAGGVQHDARVKEWLAGRAPYEEWVEDGLQPFSLGKPVEDLPDEEEFQRRQIVYGITREEVAMVLKPMANDAKEPTFSMGDDTPFAAAATQPRPVANFLKQRFAQVSNPAIDHLRERLVMSLRTCLGPRQPILTERPEAARLLELPSFFLYPSALDMLLRPDASLPSVRIDSTFPVAEGPAGLRAALEGIAAAAVAATQAGAPIVVCSDADVDAERAPVPSLLATGAIHHALIDEGLRDSASLVIDASDAHATHSVACLLGFGADAVCPRAALESVAALADSGQLGEHPAAEAQKRYQAALEDGVLKILSKMGISTVDGYRSAQIFDALGLGEEVVSLCLRGVVSVVGGVGFERLGSDVLARHDAAFHSEKPALASPGFFRHRKGGEYHANNPDVVDALHRSIALEPADGAKGKRSKDSTGRLDRIPQASADEQGQVIYLGDDGEPLPAADPTDVAAAHLLQRAVDEGRTELYATFASMVNERTVTEIRDLLEFVTVDEPLPLDEVEPAEQITRRFSTGAMSHGALSAEAHETLAMAMNLIGGKSNCGEGGEDPARFRTRGTTRDRNSRIKQIASGRFGVTPEYLSYADEINIKVAQGSKPGEGGQLPGHKVSGEIARLRHTQPGVGLISPPPHHDIYSIEDLAQLIFDLKQVNPRAEVSVKLVAEDGVGTISSGVARALAETVQISGYNGGTGASPLSSIKNAGMPWELGLADAHATLMEDELRDRVKVRVDGGFRTGRDIMIAALLGADEYSFGTAAMLAEGCIMVRACHRDTCPTGIATQRPNLRAKFVGTPEGVATYMLFIAEETRRLLAELGLRSLDDAIGRVDLLRQRVTGDDHADSLDLAPLLREPADPDAPRRFVRSVDIQRPRSELDKRLLQDAFGVLFEGGEATFDYEIANSDRTVGASLGGAIGLEWGNHLPPGHVTARFTGSAGQSFGAFLADGVTLELTGEANDYVGKGLGGGRLVIRPPDNDAGRPVLAGNTVLYGATGGQLFVAGSVGERFCVRNSGAVAVVEGTGDHACEYMTGGTVVILGEIGSNLGAGMTGGEAYVHDPTGRLLNTMNRQLVDARRPDDDHDLHFLIEQHALLTGSAVAADLLERWSETRTEFWRVAPIGEVAGIAREQEVSLGATR